MRQGAPVAVLFTDIEGSTARWESEPAAMGQALADHDRILHGAFAEAGGEVVKSTGDGALVVFDGPGAAVAAASEAQARLDAHAWPTSTPLRVRMGVHVGVVEHRDGDVFGPTVNLAARVADAGNGGQIVLSEPTRTLVAGVEAVDCGAFRLSGVAEPQPLHLVVDGRGAEATPLRALPADRTNLPADLDEFVGRQDEQAALAGLVTEARLATVCGPGGAGKTRLATRVASRLAGRFPDGVWFVDLVGVGNRTELVQALASAVGARTTAGRSFEAQVLDHLRDQRSILLLDGCEHRYEEAATLVEQLLGECPHVHVLATTREVLDVPGERVLRVAGLPVTPPTGLDEEDPADTASALFVARARAAQPALVLGPDEREAMARVCAAVDGLPLGIELAAAQLRSLTLAELPGHLAEVGARLGSSRRRRRGSRHASLAAVVSASWALVDAEDRPVLDRIGVFASAFSAESAAEVCGLSRAECVDVLGALVDKSLLVRVDREGQSRFRMLDTIRQWARDRLADHGEWDAARADHLRWALARIDDLEQAMRTERQDAAIAGVAAVHDDLRAARAFALDQGDAHAALRISASAPIDPEAERDAVLRDLLDRAGPVEPELRARTLYTSASAALERGDWANLVRFSSEAAALFGEVDDEAQAAYAHMMLAFGRWGAGGDEEVGDELRRLLDGFVATGDRFGEAYLRWALSQWLVERFEASLTLFDGAVAAVGLFEEAGSAFGRAHAAEGVAYVAVALGRLDEASAWAIDALDAFVESGHPGCAAHALDAVAVAATRRGEPAAAAELVGAADALRARVGSALRPWELEHRARCTRELAEALSPDGLQTALDRGRALDLDAAVARARALAERR